MNLETMTHPMNIQWITQSQKQEDFIEKLTEKCIDIETLYLQIYNKLTKNEKHKRTKHNDSTWDSRLT